MTEHGTNVDTVPIIVDRRDYAHLVPTHIEHHQLSYLVSSRKGQSQICYGRKVIPAYQALPFRQRRFGLQIFLGEFIQPLAAYDMHG